MVRETSAVGIKYKFSVPEDFGIQEINIESEYQSYVVQLLKETFVIEREIKNQKSFILKNLTPGKYKIRVLIDANNDGIWSPGNMYEQIEPEPVYIYPEFLIIRADWQTNLNLTF